MEFRTFFRYFRFHFFFWFLGLMFLFYAVNRLTDGGKTINPVIAQIPFDTILKEYLILAVVSTCIFSAVIGFTDYLILERYMYRTRLVWLLLSRTAISLVLIVLIRAVMVTAIIYSNEMETSYDIYFFAADFQITYMLGLSFLIGLALEVDRKLGPGKLQKLALGKFYRPSEDYRVFMFVDLVGSTAYAEQLGSARYSRLIQDCFHDISVVSKHGGEIYQYVGDEAVITWSATRGLHDLRVIDAFFAYRSALEGRREYYLSEYGRFPQFRAGAHIGKVMVAEVGIIKSEISYHGDTVNTAARIQGLSKKLQAELLVSDELLLALGGLSTAYHAKALGSQSVKGKSRAVIVHSIQKETLSIPMQGH